MFRRFAIDKAMRLESPSPNTLGGQENEGADSNRVTNNILHGLFQDHHRSRLSDRPSGAS